LFVPTVLGGLLLVAGCVGPDPYHRTSFDFGGGGAGGASEGAGGPPGAGGAPQSGAGGASPAAGGAPGMGGRGSGGAGAGGAGTGGAAGTSGTLLFSDDFESGAGKWETDSKSAPGDWTVVMDGSQVYKQGTLSNTWRAAAAGDINWTDQVVQARVKVLAFGDQSTSYLTGICARFHDEMNYYCAALRYDGKLVIRARLNNNATTLASSSAAVIAAGNWYTVKLEAIGTTLNAYVSDGTASPTKITATDSTVASGGVALGGQNTTVEYDDVTVTAP
jgi:hypothetical protein